MNHIQKNLRLAVGFLLGALLLLLPLLARAQLAGPIIHKISIQHIGPPAVSDAFIRANIRSKEGERLFRATIVRRRGQPLRHRLFFQCPRRRNQRRRRALT